MSLNLTLAGALSYLEMAGLLMLWIVIEEVFPQLQAEYVALFRYKSSTVVWVKHLAVKG